MTSERAGRQFHLATALLATFAVVFQLILVWQGHNVLDTVNPPGLTTRLIRFFSYFTIQSNILVAWATWTLALHKDSASPSWRVLRATSTVAITVTGVVHWFALRPLLNLHGADLWADRLLHLAVPIAAVAGWLIFGPRRRVDPRDIGWSVVFPLLWAIYTLAHGAATSWYPYPFVDVTVHGYGLVALTSLAILALFAALAATAYGLDRALGRTDAALGSHPG